MSAYFSEGLCFSDVARLYGEAVAQEWYERCGGTGDYVPGHAAQPAIWDTDGNMFYGGPSLGYFKLPNGGNKQFWAFEEFIKAHPRIPQPGK